jgi:hypothetical protein
MAKKQTQARSRYCKRRLRWPTRVKDAAAAIDFYANVSPEEMQRRYTEMMDGSGEAPSVEPRTQARGRTHD